MAPLNENSRRWTTGATFGSTFADDDRCCRRWRNGENSSWLSWQRLRRHLENGLRFKTELWSIGLCRLNDHMGSLPVGSTWRTFTGTRTIRACPS